MSYLDLGPASARSIAELMPGARNVMDYVALRAGEDVLILAEHGVDEAVLSALAGAAAYRGAGVSILSTPQFSAGGWDRAIPGPLVAAAHAEADVVISCTWWAEVHSAPLFFTEIPKRRARFLSLHMTATAATLASAARFPPALFYAIKQAALARCVGSRTVRVTSRHGTDLELAPAGWDTEHGPLEPGMWRPFPLGGVNCYPTDANGVLAIEESTVTGVPEEPVQIRFEGNTVTGIEGGRAADELRRFSPDGYFLRHAFLGLNPKGRLTGAPQFEREKHAGAFYLGIDALRDGQADRSGPGFAHCDCQVDRPTITIDGEPFVEDGRLLLLDDPAVREAASAFGPPDVLLDDNWRLVLPARYSGQAG